MRPTMHAYSIGRYSFVAEDLIDATIEAINTARQLFQAGKVEEANSLHKEALMLRQLAQGGSRFTPLPRRAILNAAGF